MPKYCTAPNCKNDSGNANDRKSFYKFPLQDPSRLQQWLKNMGRDDWVPSRHQYICHEHFTESCFKLRWGIRYLDNDAVPTVFSVPEKRKGMDHTEKKSKRFCYNGDPGETVSDDETPATDTAELDSSINTVQLYEITVDPSQSAETMLIETSDVRNSIDFLHSTTLPQPGSEDRLDTEADFPVTLFQTVEDISGLDSEESTEVLLVSACSPVEGHEEMMILTQGQGLVVTDSTLGNMEERQTSLVVQRMSSDIEELSAVHNDHGTPVIAYFETIPNVLPNGVSTQFAITPDTVLSSALGSKPIVSTLPIVSKHMPPSPTSLVLTMERLETEMGEGERNSSEEDSVEQQENQLEEHCYHKNSLSKEQLEAIVAELQKKVKVLQQRHRRHLEKLLGLENTVSQLRQNNLLNEERLQLLERAYIQTSAAVSEAGETVAIIYEDDNTAYLYATLTGGEEEA